MAITGLLLIGFVIAHLVGNLKIFLGPEASGVYEIDEYGHALRELFYPILPRHIALWLMRVGLILAFALHVHAATALTFMNRRARTIDYQGPRQYLAANYASRTMRWSGYIVLAYLASIWPTSPGASSPSPPRVGSGRASAPTSSSPSAVGR